MTTVPAPCYAAISSIVKDSPRHRYNGLNRETTSDACQVKVLHEHIAANEGNTLHSEMDLMRNNPKNIHLVPYNYKGILSTVHTMATDMWLERCLAVSQ